MSDSETPPSDPSIHIDPTGNLLTSQQRALYDALSRKDQKLAGMYMGVIYALAQTANPDALAQAAHSARELMEKIARHYNFPTKHLSLKEEAMKLYRKWHHAKKHSCCYSDTRWSRVS